MNRKIAKSLSALLFAAALAVTQIPVSDAEASETASDFQMEGDFYDDSHSYVTISVSPCHKEDQNPYKTKMPKCKEIKNSAT